MIDGQEIFVGFVSDDEAVIYTATVISAEHRLVRKPWGVEMLHDFEGAYGSEAEAMAGCAAAFRAQSRLLDARADELTARAAAMTVGAAKPE